MNHPIFHKIEIEVRFGMEGKEGTRGKEVEHAAGLLGNRRWGRLLEQRKS